MPKKHKSAAEIIWMQGFCRTAKQCDAVIILSILQSIFGATEKYMTQFYEAFKRETSKYNCWTPGGLKKAEEDFKKVAKTYNTKICPAPEKMAMRHRESDEIIIYTECTCLYIAMRILYDIGGFNYKMLDEFANRYIEFNQIYEEGEQVDMWDLSDQLEEFIGINILRGAKHGN